MAIHSSTLAWETPWTEEPGGLQSKLTAGQYIIRWTSVLSNRFDTTGFKKVYGDLYKAFTKQTNSRRFSISC